MPLISNSSLVVAIQYDLRYHNISLYFGGQIQMWRYCGNEVFILNFLWFSSYVLCDTETFCTPGDLLVHHGSPGRLTALVTLVTKIIRGIRRQHCSYSKSVHLRTTWHQLWCETRRAGLNLKLSVVSVYGGTQREHTHPKAVQTHPQSNGEMDKLTIDSHCCSVTMAIISAMLESQGQGRIDCLVLPSTLMDVGLIKMSNKSISYTMKFWVSSWEIKLGS